jgi:hypothetical protein
MAIQERENDLVLGTHGRGVFVIDDYSGLRNLSHEDFESRLKILSATVGQHYVANQTPSTRFTASAEFRAENEPYGVMLTFMASGQDLPHPDAEAERERKILMRESRDETVDEQVGKGEAKVTVTVKDASGDVIRSYRELVHQGVNRLTWDMRRDGVRAMPGPEERDYEDGLPAGPEVPPGDYSVTLVLDHPDSEATVASIDVHTVADPRSPYSQSEVEQNYTAQLELLKLQKAVVSAVERIVNARKDINAIAERIEARKQAAEDEKLTSLQDRAKALKDNLDELEKRFRTPPETKGVPYDADKIASRLTLAQGYVASTYGAPSAAAMTYVQLARDAVDQGLTAVNGFIGGELGEFRQAVEQAGIGLLSGVQAVTYED